MAASTQAPAMSRTAREKIRWERTVNGRIARFRFDPIILNIYRYNIYIYIDIHGFPDYREVKTHGSDPWI